MTNEEIKDKLYRMLSDVVNGSFPIRNNTQRGKYREAVKEAIEVLDQTKWIPVSERLPEENGRYLTYIENPYYNSLSYIMICDYIQSTWCPDDETASNYVTYWMPLPAKPYKEEGAREMTYGDIYNEFCKKFPNAGADDYRPAMPQYLPWLVKPIPCAIVVWLKDGSEVVYIAESEE